MRRSSPTTMLAMFMLGACSTVAAQSARAPTVVSLAEAPHAMAPSGTASITHLARGHNAYLGLLRMDAGGAVPVHRDATEEFIHVLAGGGTMTIDGQTHTITAGTTIYMPANAEVSFQNGDDPMVALQVFAGPEPAAKYDAWALQP